MEYHEILKEPYIPSLRLVDLAERAEQFSAKYMYPPEESKAKNPMFGFFKDSSAFVGWATIFAVLTAFKFILFEEYDEEEISKINWIVHHVSVYDWYMDEPHMHKGIYSGYIHMYFDGDGFSF